jgi:hypothetical protein
VREPPHDDDGFNPQPTLPHCSWIKPVLVQRCIAPEKSHTPNAPTPLHSRVVQSWGMQPSAPIPPF